MRVVGIGIALALATACTGDHATNQRDTLVGSSGPAITGHAQDDAHRVGTELLGMPDTTKFKYYGASLIATSAGIYNTYQLGVGDHQEVWLTRVDIQKRVPGDKAALTVVATMIPPETLNDDVRLWIHDCMKDGVADPKLITVLSYDTLPIHTRIIRAWTVDTAGPRFTSIPVTGISCGQGRVISNNVVTYSPPPPPPPAGASVPAAELMRLPALVRDTLSARGCLIPPSRETDSSTNVMRGNFLGSGIDSWAVWCVAGDNSDVLVFRDGLPQPMAQTTIRLARPPRDGANDPRAPGKRFGCVGSLHRTAMGGEVLKDVAAEVDSLFAVERSTLPHDGIEDLDCEGVSAIHYWTGRRWVVLPGGH